MIRKTFTGGQSPRDNQPWDCKLWWDAPVWGWGIYYNYLYPLYLLIGSAFEIFAEKAILNVFSYDASFNRDLNLTPIQQRENALILKYRSETQADQRIEKHCN